MTGRRRNTSSRLRQRVTLQEEIKTADGVGGYVRSWKDVVQLWVEIVPISGKENVSADRLQSTATHRILMRRRADVNASQRLLLEERAFNILYVADAGTQAGILELLVEEGGI